jgi:hypothetical protein
MKHRCESRGCSEGYFTIDGNEKLRRCLCAYPKKIHIGEDGLKIHHVCSNDPEYGNQGKKPEM